MADALNCRLPAKAFQTSLAVFFAASSAYPAYSTEQLSPLLAGAAASGLAAGAPVAPS